MRVGLSQSKDRLDCKLPLAAAIKSRGRERNGKGMTRSCYVRVQGDERKQITIEASKETR